jgi:hypothetical protein
MVEVIWCRCTDCQFIGKVTYDSNGATGICEDAENREEFIMNKDGRCPYRVDKER